jgi:hypothetical protein
MKIKIIKCSNPARWYANYIGRVFEVKSYSYVGFSDEEHILQALIVQPSPDFNLFVEGEDLEVIKEEDLEIIEINKKMARLVEKLKKLGVERFMTNSDNF